jgi:hypothetical protein
VIPHVGECFADKSISNNKKVKTEDTFVENKNLTTKTELFSKSFLEQIYRFEQLAFPQVGGWFTNNSAIDNKKENTEKDFVKIKNLTTKNRGFF